MLDLLRGTLDLGDGDVLHIGTALDGLLAMPAAARLQRQENPHVVGLCEFSGLKETSGPLLFHMNLSFRDGQAAGWSLHLANGPMSPFDWNTVTEQMLKDEIRWLTRWVDQQVGRLADRPAYPHAPAFGGNWDLPWGTVGAHGEPRSYTCGIYLTPSPRTD
jgi:hypothetical protein